jgi:hypothetical protein
MTPRPQGMSGIGGMMAYLRAGSGSLVLTIALALAAAPLASAGSFTFSSPGWLYAVGQGGGAADFSGIHVVDTPDGVEVTGSLYVTVPDTYEGQLWSGYATIFAKRYFDAPLGSPVTLTAHMSGSASTTGGLSVYAYSATTMLAPNETGAGPCSVTVGVGEYPIALPGAFSGTKSASVSVGQPIHTKSLPCSRRKHFTK